MSKAPICDACGIQMVEKRNNTTLKKFYGCPNYPACTETAQHEDGEHDEECDCDDCTVHDDFDY